MPSEIPHYFRLGLTGYPLGHSLSPRLHQAALYAARLTGEYQLYPQDPAEPGGLAGLVERLRRGELDGLNVTIPHKQTVLPLLDELTPLAARIGAVNTLFMKAGRVYGDNTDAPAFWANFCELRHAAQTGLALVLGAGGAARAVCAALLDGGWRVHVAARRPEQAAELLESLQAGPQGQSGSLEAAGLVPLLREARALINTTPLGMSPHTAECPWPAELPLPPMALVVDLIYNPAQTRLLQRAQAAGQPAGNGLGMLIEQAALAFERWTGFSPPREALVEAVPSELRPASQSG